MSNRKDDSKALEYWRKWAKKKYIDVDSDSDARLRTLIDYEIGWLQGELKIAMDFVCKMDAENQTPERSNHASQSWLLLFTQKDTEIANLQNEVEALRAQLEENNLNMEIDDQQASEIIAEFETVLLDLLKGYEAGDIGKAIKELRQSLGLNLPFQTDNIKDIIAGVYKRREEHKTLKKQLEEAQITILQLQREKESPGITSDYPRSEIEALRAQLAESMELNRQAYYTLDVHCPNEEITDKLFNFLKEKYQS